MTKHSSRPARRLVTLIGLIGIALLGAACGSSGDGDGSTGDELTVAFVPGVTQNPYFSTIRQAMVEVGNENGIKVDYQGTPNFDPAQQTKVLDAVLAQRPDLLVLAPTDPVALRAPVERFLRAKIPVIIVDGALTDDSDLVSTIQGDGVQGGNVAGAQMAKLVGGSGTVAIINIVAGNINLDARVKGFKDALAEAAPQVKIAPIQNAGGNPSGSQAAARSLLVAYPDLKGIFGVTEVNAEGAAAALKAAGKTGTVPVIAYDATPLEVKYLESGQIQYLVAQDARGVGKQAMEYAVAYLKGDRSSIKKSVVLETKGIDLASTGSPDVKPFLYAPADN